jgi:hypothetical protein
MKKLGLIGAVLLIAASPVWARVDITCTADGNIVTVRYKVSDANKVRALALDIMVNSPARIHAISDPNAKYWVYPGSIVIVNGEVNNVGTPVANPYDPCVPGGTQPGLDTNGITIEMGSLYSPTGDNSPNSPAKTGPLLKFNVEKRQSNTTVTIRENTVRGGVVLTNGSHPDVNAPGIYGTPKWPLDCLIGGNAGTSEYKDWVAFGYPKCWCYPRNCRGDINGTIKFGTWVTVEDLTLFKTAYGKSVAQIPPGGICADLDRKIKFGIRVSVEDLTIFKLYYGKATTLVPTCDKTPTNTGPYNWWAAP